MEKYEIIRRRMIYVGVVVFLIALVVLLYNMYFAPQAVQEPIFDKQDAKTFAIPEMIPGPGEEPILLGVETPPTEYEYPDHEGEKPLFFYTNPWLWEKQVYRLEDTTSDYVVKCGNFMMWITNWGLTGPVWRVTAYQDGNLVGVTDHFFIFEDDDQWFGVEEGDTLPGVVHRYEDVSMDEQATKKEVESKNLSFGINVQLNSFDDEFVHYSLDRNSLSVEFEWTASKKEVILLSSEENRTWYKIGQKKFFVQKRAPYKDAVFIGGIDGIGRVMVLSFIGEFVKADMKGIYYLREGTLYFKSYIPLYINNYAEHYVEIPAKFLDYIEFPAVGQGNSNDKSRPLKTPLF